MREPYLKEVQAFGEVKVEDRGITFINTGIFLLGQKLEDFETNICLRLIGAAEIASLLPEFFGYNVPDSYRFSNKEVYYKTEDCINTHHEVIIKSMGCGCKSRDDGQRCGAGRRFEEVYDFTTMTEAKSFMFRLVLCWLKVQLEDEAVCLPNIYL